MRPVMRVIEGSRSVRRSALRAAYEHFRLERQGNLVSAQTLAHYDFMVLPFLDWLEDATPQAADFQALDVASLRHYRAELAARPGRHGRLLQPETIRDSHRALLTFFRWARSEGYELDERILALRRPQAAHKEATLYHLGQLRQILAACNPRLPQEELAVRILVGSGIRASELCGLAVAGPDGLPDLMLDSLRRGRVELRVRWNAGAKGRRTRRVPITAKLAAQIKRYEARNRPAVPATAILINERGRPYNRFGVDAIMDRLQLRVGFRVHAHGFRHTFGTVATKLGWNLEFVRAALGHAGYGELLRYVRLATERDLGPRKEWEEFVLANPSVE